MKRLFLCLSIVLSFAASAQRITWYQHIAPIVHTNCTPCHRPDEAGPFSLITYEDVAKRAAMVKRVTQSRYMPPWKADPHYVNYANERRLTDEEIAMIANWADHQMPVGKNDKDKPDTITTSKVSRLPDLELTMKQAFVIKGDNVERFIVYKIPFELPDSMNVEAIRFITNNRKLIHHANYEIDDVPELDLYNTVDYINLTEDDRNKYTQYVPYRHRMIYYGGWIPGASYESYPPGIGWRMPKRGVILLTLHFAPVGKEEKSISGVQLYFTKNKVKRDIRAVSIGSGGVGEKDIDPFFYIPANAVKTFKVKVKVPEDQSLLYVWPHMHYLGKIFRAYSVTPANDTVRLVSIPDWNVAWQEMYWFPTLKKLPKGSTIYVEGTYDNTAENPANPNNPPQLIYSSGDMRSTDEMMTLVMIYLPYENGDERMEIKQ
ncbi:cytochrome c [Chitinophaga sp.]|uniref:c-type cytochrome n=1 Tax=Chitinophaga sp. TaxID=1869181 RepID=UPI0031DBFEEC